MVQTSVYTCNNVNLDPEMCLRRGEGVKLETRVVHCLKFDVIDIFCFELICPFSL